MVAVSLYTSVRARHLWCWCTLHIESCILSVLRQPNGHSIPECFLEASLGRVSRVISSPTFTKIQFSASWEDTELPFKTHKSVMQKGFLSMQRWLCHVHSLASMNVHCPFLKWRGWIPCSISESTDFHWCSPHSLEVVSDLGFHGLQDSWGLKTTWIWRLPQGGRRGLIQLSFLFHNYLIFAWIITGSFPMCGLIHSPQVWHQ